MSEIGDVHQAEDHRQPNGDKGVTATDNQPLDHEADGQIHRIPSLPR